MTKKLVRQITMKSSVFLNSIVTFCAFCTCFLGFGQVSSFKNYGLEKNAFPSRIECINQASTGELYIGTLAGLVVYNGYDFKQYFEKDGLAENAISAIGVYNESVWIGHWAGSVTIINAQTHTKQAIDLKEKLNFSTIKDIFPKSDSTAILVSKEGRLFYYQPSGIEQIEMSGALESEQVIDIVGDTNEYFAITKSGVYAEVNEESGQKWPQIYKSEYTLTSAYQIQASNWALGHTEGVTFIDFKDGAKTELKTESAVSSIVQDLEEFVWIGTGEHGVIKYHPISRSLEQISRQNGLSYGQVRKIFLDREGQIWIATSAGLDQYLGRAFELYDEKTGLPDNLIWDFAQVGDEMLTATSGGLYLLNIQSNGLIDPIKKYDLNGEEPRKLAVFQNGQKTYAITYEGGLWFRKEEGAFVKIEQIQSEVKCIEEVSGEIWVGTRDGIFKLMNNVPIEQYAEQSGLGGNNVNGIYYSKIKNETWVTVLGGQCALYRDGRFRLFGPDEGMTSNVIQDAAFDVEGNPWFASYDDGVLYFAEGEFHSLSEKVDLSSNTTFAIEIGEDQSVWIGHNWGIDLYRIPYEDIAHFGSDQGFMGVEVNPGAIKKHGQNELWMGTLMGLLKFAPTYVRTNVAQPITRIVSAKLSDYNLVSEGSYRLDFKESNLSVEFEGVSLVNPSLNTFQYRIIGVHEDWKVKSEMQPIEYLALPPGDFILQLKTCNNSGICNEDPVELKFSILPPIYKTWWFYTLVFIFIVIAIFLMDRYRVLSLVDEKNRLLERLTDMDQENIEWRQRVESLESQSKYNASVLDQMNFPSILSLTDRMLVKTKNIDEFSSDQFLDLSIGTKRIVGMVDVGVSGNLAPYLFGAMKVQFLEKMKESKSGTEEEIFTCFGEAVHEVALKLEKHRGSNWVIWIENSSQYKISVYDSACFQILNRQVVELHGGKDDVKGTIFDIAKEGRLFVASDGLKDQLSLDGIRKYSLKRLIGKLDKMSDAQSSEVLDSIVEDFDNWRGDMEQTDDLTLLILNA